MPFKSKKQRAYLWANKPEIAKRWTEAYGSSPIKKSMPMKDKVKKRGM